MSGSHAIANLRHQVDDLVRAIKARLGTRQGQRHDLRHHDEKQDEHGVFQHRRDAADLHGVRAHAVAAKPQHGDLCDVHKEERRAVQAGEQPIHLDGGLGVAREDVVQALVFMLFLVEGADHADAGDVFTQHHVHAVDEALQSREDGRGVCHRDRGDDQHHGDHDRKQDAHLIVDGSCQRDSHDAHDGHGQHHLDGHDDGLLNDIDVVEGAGDHGAGAEALEVAAGERQRAIVHGVANVTAHVGRQLSGQIAAQQRAAARQRRSAQHGQSVLQDVVEVLGSHADVDHVRQQRRHQQRAGDVDHQHQHGDNGKPPIGLHVL